MPVSLQPNIQSFFELYHRVYTVRAPRCNTFDCDYFVKTFCLQ